MTERFDVVLIGGGIMSATLGTLLKELEPTWRIAIIEKLDEAGHESSDPWNNAGTGHSALAELNYTPEQPDGSIDITRAVAINEQFQMTRQFWSHLVDEGVLTDPATFMTSTPHISFVRGDADVEYLRKRHCALAAHPLFRNLEFSDDPLQIQRWAPLLMDGRPAEVPVAATRSPAGTDVDFGSITRQLIAHLATKGAEVFVGTRVTQLRRDSTGWRVETKSSGAHRTYHADFVFVGAGGDSLRLLQKSRIAEIRGYAGFPISGQFLRSDSPELAALHAVKVYGKAAFGSPPMSVPHLDARVVDGKVSLMFGPYAGFSPRFLKSGSPLDLPSSVRWHNLRSVLGAGLHNLGLVRYLFGQLLASENARFRSLVEFVPRARMSDWHLILAGQRVQVIKRDSKGRGVLQFGTEVVMADDRSIAGLLGASPGASTAVPIMIDLIRDCFPERSQAWSPRLSAIAPTLGTQLSSDPELARATIAATAATLGIAN